MSDPRARMCLWLEAGQEAPRQKGVTMSEKKMTKREAFLFALSVIESEKGEDATRAFDVIAHEIEMLDKKRSSKGVDTKRLAEQTAIMDSIVAVLDTAVEPMRATAIADALGDGTTVQRVSALLKKLVDAKTVERIEQGKVTTFRLK